MGKNIPRRIGHTQPQLTQGDDALLAKQRGLMLAARAKRVAPARDNNMLADWNGLAISALAQAGAVLEHPDWVKAAITAFDAVVKMLGDGDRLYHSIFAGHFGAKGVADDYAMMARARAASVGSDRRSALPRRRQTLGCHPWIRISGIRKRAAIAPLPTMPNR